MVRTDHYHLGKRPCGYNRYFQENISSVLRNCEEANPALKITREEVKK